MTQKVKTAATKLRKPQNPRHAELPNLIERRPVGLSSARDIVRARIVLERAAESGNSTGQF